MSDPLLHTESRRVEGDEVDFKKELRLSTLLRYCQEAAGHHLAALGLTDSYIRSLSLHWVVSRYHIEIKRLPHHDEKVRIETHAGPIRAILFPRYFNIYDENEELIVRACSIWALVDEAKRTMIVPSTYNLPEFGKLYGDEIPFSLSLHLPKKGELTELKATYSSCDINGHINNCAYFDLLEDRIDPSFLRQYSPQEVDIQYKKEVMFDSDIPLYIDMNDNLYSFYSDYFLASILFKKSE